METLTNRKDAELMKAYMNGDEEAFEILVKKYQAKIYTTIYIIVKDDFVAQDLMQETFLKVIQKIRSGLYNEEGKFYPWVMRIAHNKAIDYYRKQKKYPTVEMEDRNEFIDSLHLISESAEDIKMKDETIATLKILIEELPDKQKEVLIMRNFMQMSFQEIADQTNVSINTALGRMRYAIVNLRKKMIDTNNLNHHEKILA
ncbi:RNA polymerase sigma factor [Aureibacter tunicatorum]|uniref:RNA polymerase sigma-70 factor (ECF subfamily) n=1 Tax=Aureibacter tunicatorum TaxID=866807 RepID=A0AAE4BRS1_9BACT|nr:sigma-70 family RNA polymerase sigma factor [Aureibacter tunicatorum]MDR6237522.1 RNA polymerase sigma-70 factor (ECF subfamily) [Aureibacter tunicatorum]BDD02556.1 RNA polymerase subunit sigma-24 [Aureibacter tunicatorum]